MKIFACSKVSKKPFAFDSSMQYLREKTKFTEAELMDMKSRQDCL